MQTHTHTRAIYPLSFRVILAQQFNEHAAKSRKIVLFCVKNKNGNTKKKDQEQTIPGNKTPKTIKSKNRKRERGKQHAHHIIQATVCIIQSNIITCKRIPAEFHSERAL